jgi:hypothetical protein
MKFMVTWSIPDGDARHDTLKIFSDMSAEDDQAMMGDSLSMIGRWHDLVSMTGAAVFESDNAAAVSNYILNWNHVCDCDVTPVLDDEETRALGRSRG